MGEAMCGNLARRAGCRVLGHDMRREPLDRLAERGGAGGVDGRRDGGRLRSDFAVAARWEGGAGGDFEALQPLLSPGQCVVDTSTSPVDLTRRIGGAAWSGAGIGFADAPVARTREAAQRGELSIMVGAAPEVFAHIAPVLRTMGTDVTHCGGIGCGQVVKILEQHAAVSERGGAGGGDRAGSAQWRRTGDAAGDDCEGVG